MHPWETTIGAVVSIMLLISLMGCSPPTALPQANEHAITGAGSYRLPRWSLDGRYLAFKEGRDDNLMVYDLEARKSWLAVGGSPKAYFDWTPSGQLSYLKYRPDLSGMPFPAVHDLHIVERDGSKDHVIAENLYNAGDYVWFRNGQKLFMRLTDKEDQTGGKDIYTVDVVTSNRARFLSRQEMRIRSITTMALAPDEKSLLIYAHRGEGTLDSNISLLLLYDLETRRLIREIDLNQMFGKASSVPGVRGGIDGKNLNYVKVGEQKWAVSTVSVVEGECYRDSLFFLNIDELAKNFCITTKEAAINQAVLSPDLSKVAYLNYVGGVNSYVMIADLTPEIRKRLEK